MNSSIFRFNLDLHTTQSQISIPVLQGDTNRTWKISFTDGENPVKLTTGIIATLNVKRPGGTFLVASCAIKDETSVIYNFEQNKNTAAEEGIHDCDITLYNSNGLLIGSPRFTMVVSERAIDSDDINIPEEDLIILDDILIAEAGRDEAERRRINAEAARVSAESVRIKAEEARQEATAEAIEKAENAAKVHFGANTPDADSTVWIDPNDNSDVIGTAEKWTFTLEDGSTVTKIIAVLG
jgi:hypothetical protein